MNELDIIFAAITLFLFIRGIFRGFLVEAASLAGAVGGYYAANRYSQEIIPFIQRAVPSPSWAGVVSYLVVFFAVILAVTILAKVVKSVLLVSFANWFDYLVGGVAGLAKGLFICCVILAVVQSFMPEAGFVAGSRFAPYLGDVAGLIKQYVPQAEKVI